MAAWQFANGVAVRGSPKIDCLGYQGMGLLLARAYWSQNSGGGFEQSIPAAMQCWTLVHIA